MRLAALAFLCSAVAAAAAEVVFEAEGARLVVPVDDIAAAVPVAVEDRASVSLQLAYAASTAFADLTGGSIGRPLAITLCGRELLRPVVRERIASGQVLITVPDQDHATAVSEVLNGVADCDRLNGLFDD